MTRLALLSSLYLAAQAVALASCAPEYRSGGTGCAGGICPEGFVCVNKVCYLPGDRRAGGDADPGPIGSDGGPPGTDASPTVTRDSCRPPAPLFCGARGDVPATCQREGLDCATSIRCADGVRTCSPGAVASCQYRADYCDLAARSCAADPDYPVRCAARGDIGPGCWGAATDCSTRTICADEVFSRACQAGQTVDCRYKADSCTPGDTCPAAFPRSCPGMGDIGPDHCWSNDIDCNTRVYCDNDDRVKACPAGRKPDCQYAIDYCLPAETCSGDFPQLCPPLDRFGPGCWAATTDCSTRKLCDSAPRVRACRMGLQADCRYRADFCIPPGGACTDPNFPERCEAMGDLGPRCLTRRPSGAAPHDCNGRKACGSETSTTVCPVGFTVDCSRPFESRCVSQTPRPDAGTPPDADAGSSPDADASSSPDADARPGGGGPG